MAPLKTSVVPSYDKKPNKVNKYLINEYSIWSVLGGNSVGYSGVVLDFLGFSKFLSDCSGGKELYTLLCVPVEL